MNIWRYLYGVLLLFHKYLELLMGDNIQLATSPAIVDNRIIRVEHLPHHLVAHLTLE